MLVDGSARNADPAGCRDALFTVKPTTCPVSAVSALGPPRCRRPSRAGVGRVTRTDKIAQVRGDFHGAFHPEAEALELVGERTTWYQLDEYALDALARRRRSRSSEVRPDHARVDPLPCVGGLDDDGDLLATIDRRRSRS